MRASTHGRGEEIRGQLVATLNFERAIPRPEHVRIQVRVLLLVLKTSTTRLIVDAAASRSKSSVFQTVEMGTRAPD
jgi:hypothetical protein